MSTPSAPELSVVIPAFNEARTLGAVVTAVLRAWVDLEIILVDDGSGDGTWEVMQACADGDRVRCLRHHVNLGKGAAVRTGLEAARGSIVLIQDADLEQDPKQYPELLAPLLSGRATVVFGTRFGGAAADGYRSLLYTLGNRVVTWATNLIYWTHITDMENGYKVMPRTLALRLDLQSRGFDIEPEITAKILRLGHRVTEVPVTYSGRSRAEGKKLTAKDGIRAIGVLFRYRLWRPRDQAPLPSTDGVGVGASSSGVDS